MTLCHAGSCLIKSKFRLQLITKKTHFRIKAMLSTFYLAGVTVWVKKFSVGKSSLNYWRSPIVIVFASFQKESRFQKRNNSKELTYRWDATVFFCPCRSVCCWLANADSERWKDICVQCLRNWHFGAVPVPSSQTMVCACQGLQVGILHQHTQART